MADNSYNQQIAKIVLERMSFSSVLLSLTSACPAEMCDVYCLED